MSSGNGTSSYPCGRQACLASAVDASVQQLHRSLQDHERRLAALDAGLQNAVDRIQLCITDHVQMMERERRAMTAAMIRFEKAAKAISKPRGRR